MNIHRLVPALAGLVLTLTAARLAHAVPEQVGLTARVVDADVPITGAHTFQIRLFGAATGGTALWTESDAATADDGLVYLTLGDQVALDADVLDGGPLWVELQVDSTVLAPRLGVTSAPYAVRAGVAENAELLGGQPASSFAAVDHTHAGVYLPVGANLTCPGTQKVTGVNPNGSVVCGADVDTDTNTTYTAGTGLALTGTQFGVSLTATTCPAGQKVSAISSTGVATCAADLDTDTNTTYSAGAGLTLTGTSFAPTFGGTGTASTVARSDHDHVPTSCPATFTSFSSTTTRLCVRSVAAAVDWYGAARGCMSLGGANLCRQEQIVRARGVTAFGVNGNYWLGDKVGDNLAAYTNNAVGTTINSDDIDGVSTVTDAKSGYYCCAERTWF